MNLIYMQSMLNQNTGATKVIPRRAKELYLLRYRNINQVSW